MFLNREQCSRKRTLRTGVRGRIAVLISFMLFSAIVSSAMVRLVAAPEDETAGETAAPKGQEKKPTVQRAAKRESKSSLERYRERQARLKLQQDTIPDSLLHPRWKIQKTTPVTYDDLKQGTADLKRPDNIKQEVEYNDTLDRYVIGTRMGQTWLAAPVMMSLPEYQKWSEKNIFYNYFRSKNSEIFEKKGKEKFDFTDMHFDLGPAEKIFGPGGIRVKTQGTAELKLGATLKSIDNPSLPIRNRKTTTIDFDEKININVTGKIGDKMNMNLNYNTDATFDYDAQNMKLKYDGKEDEIIKLVEAGNVSFPSNSSLVQGASSLFGVRTDMQFGKLKLQTVISQKKSASTSVSTKGGVQLTPYEINVANYEENRHFFLATYFRDRYDVWMQSLPNVTTGITINRVEVWVTNKSGQTSNTRNIIALSDLAEGTPKNTSWGGLGRNAVPSNNANSEYSTMVNAYGAARDVNQTSTVLNGVMAGGVDYEKIEKARLLNSSEYTVNRAMGYISLKTTLQSDQVLAVAYEYTSGGVTYQVGEFSSDHTDVNQALYVKSLKNTSSTPSQPNWKLMMRNVYYLASSVQKEKFRLDIKYKSDTVGVYVNYIPEARVKSIPLIRLLGADRLDNNNRVHSNGYFDYVDGYTISNGRVFLPKVEPFGTALHDALLQNGVTEAVASRYRYQELYDSTRTIAKQIAEKNRYQITGQFKGTSENEIMLGAYNVPQGSVVVTAGGVTLVEGSDYTVDYVEGKVRILNQSILDAGTNVNVSLESNSDYGMARKTMFGVNWEYDFSKDFQISGTLQHLSEQSLTSKVTMGTEPVNNTLVGFNINWKKDSQWLTKMLNKIPFLHVTQPSNIQFNAEFAKLFSSIAGGTQDNASYIDDFEATTTGINVLTPTSWTLASVPRTVNPSPSKTDLTSGYNRARLAWYTIDPLFTRRSSTLTPGHIKEDLEQLSNHYVREVYVSELYPNRDQATYSGATSTLGIMNLAYYPQERGPYNFNPAIDQNGHLLTPRQSWGGMMRKLDTNDFQEANIEYIEFWMLDPFVYTRNDGTASKHTGKLYFNLGEVSEDILLDGKKFYESGMPVNGRDSVTTTQWGKIPVQNTINYAFATSSGSREKQDVGFNGLNNEEERAWGPYQEFLTSAIGTAFDGSGVVRNDSVLQEIIADPANDDYKYFRGDFWDRKRASILDRYKYINNPQGNSPDSDSRTEAYDTSYKTGPDVEDINQDYTLNEYEKYYQYCVEIDPNQLNVGSNYIVDKREATVSLRNGKKETVTWYQFRVPINRGTPVGGINDFSSIRFMRMYMTDFEETTVLRLASLDLVRGDWRVYEQQIKGASANPTARFTTSSINIEENNDKKPVNYVLPPGISRVVDPTQQQLTENNEQAMRFDLTDMSHADAVAVYKNSTHDMRYYNRLQMFVHANALEQNVTNLQNGQLALFLRLGSDYNNNYYEYEIPLKLTAPGVYNTYSVADCRAVWPEENMLDIELKKFTALKKERNKKKALGLASFNAVYSEYDSDNQSNKISIVGNPSLGEVRTMMIGVRNNSNDIKDGEVWVNELRLLEPESDGGWAAAANLNVQLSDFGNVAASGKYISDGYGGLEQKVMERTTDKFGSYTVTANAELGKFFPDKAKVTIPVYYSVTKEKTTPKYNPLDTDMLLDDALESAANEHEKDSIRSIAVTNTVSKNFSVSGMRVGIATKRHPMPYDPANFTFSYSRTDRHTDGQTTVYENEEQWRGVVNYSWTPVYKSLTPFKKIKSKSKNYDILKKFALNWLPQNISANSEMTRNYYELQERDLEDLGSSNSIPATFSSQFLWNREFSMRWDLTSNLHMNFQSATRAEIEEPYTQINKDLYPERYQAWKDSIWSSIKRLGTPLDYNQTFTASYKLPLYQLPILDWMQANASYSATYRWARGTEQEDGYSFGNTINSNRSININSTLNLVNLYNHIPFLKKVNEKFNRTPVVNRNRQQQKKPQVKTKEEEDPKKAKEQEEEAKKKREEAKVKLAEERKKKNTFTREITVKADTAIVITHGKKSKRLLVSAKDKNGKAIDIKYKKVDENKIKIINRADSDVTMKISVLALEPLENLTWYKVAQSASRVLMMVRNIGITYRNQYSMVLPGFMPNVGDVFGQRTGGVMSPGLDFAFGMIDDSYIDKARSNGWLLYSDSVATPATTNTSQDLQVKLTLEPVRNLKIDLNMMRNKSTSRSIQYMYDGSPTTQSGSFSMTTISIKSAFEGMGDANNGYHSASFERFCNSLDNYRARVQARYEGAIYPAGTAMAGQKFNAANGGVNRYSADVMIPAFLDAYTGNSDLNLFPTLKRMLPNWTIRYSGLAQLPWIRDRFKSVNINHSYKSVFAVGSYSSYSTYKEFMGDMIGFVSDATTGNPIPNSMYNISSVSINEAFSPLLGLDFTLPNNLTFKAEYRTTRVLNLSMTSVQINEAISKDWVFGIGYKIADFRFMRSRALAAASRNRNKGNADDNQNQSSSRVTNKSKGFAHDLNLRLDISLRSQAALTRDIASMSSSATSGNDAFKLAFSADYTLSRLLTMSFYYDRQSNTPLLSAGSYPTVTQDFGLSMKFSLTR
ncbi:MAG: cell surface protein SprA [Prevotellaceae bacterium]|nr:cell surface protein SprA [Prevotellaceae bacterium]